MSAQTEAVLVGMGGWDLFPFDNVFYPSRTVKGFRKLEYYSRYFDFVEVNATFYNIAFGPAQARRWIQDVSENRKFMFAVKLYRGFTHLFDATREDVLVVRNFLEVFASEGKLIGLVAQFPYSFHYTLENLKYLTLIGNAFQPHPIFVEVRHNSWNQLQIFHILQENKLHLVNVDLPGIKHHMPLTAESWNNKAYFRMMGRNAMTWDRSWKVNATKSHLVSDRYLYLYTEQELNKLANVIKSIVRNGTKAQVVFHNDPKANSLVNGFLLRRLLTSGKLSIPENLLKERTELRPISTGSSIGLPLFNQDSSSGSRHREVSLEGEFTARETG